MTRLSFVIWEKAKSSQKALNDAATHVTAWVTAATAHAVRDAGPETPSSPHRGV
jgi:hypothetical protein